MLLYIAENKSAQSVGVGDEGDEGEKAWITREGVGELMSFIIPPPSPFSLLPVYTVSTTLI